jgi:hypothetical protein
MKVEFDVALPRPSPDEIAIETLKQLLEACDSAFLAAAQPFRLIPKEWINGTTTALLPALLGLYDVELSKMRRGDGVNITVGHEPNGFPVTRYAVVQAAVALILRSRSSLTGTARPSLAQLERLLPLAGQAILADKILTLQRDGLAEVSVSGWRKRSVEFECLPITKRFGTYDPFEYLSLLAQAPHGSDELLPAIEPYLADGEELPLLLAAVSDSMRSSSHIGFGVEEICELLRGIFVSSPNARLLVFERKTLIASLEKSTKKQFAKLVEILTFDVALGADVASLNLSEAGPTQRLVTAPLVDFGNGKLASTPELANCSLAILLGNIISGKLPNGGRPPRKSDLIKDLDRWINYRTTVRFEAEVRSQVHAQGFRTLELIQGGLPTVWLTVLV